MTEIHDLTVAELAGRELRAAEAVHPLHHPVHLSGQPAVSVPLHWNGDGLPIGVMLAGRMGEESTLISLSAQLEAAGRGRTGTRRSGEQARQHAAAVTGARGLP